jgi:single-strand DNA-binding protein
MDGLPMAKFRLAVGRPASQGATDFMDIVAWRRVAEVCGEYLRKGRLVLVEGRIQNRSFEDQTGKRRWVTEVVARSVEMLEKPNVQSPKSSTRDAGQMTDDELVDDESLASDLPF